MRTTCHTDRRMTALDSLTVASIERAEDDAALRRVAALSAAVECIDAAQAGDGARAAEAADALAVRTAETLALSSAIPVVRARLAVSRFVAGIRGARLLAGTHAHLR